HVQRIAVLGELGVAELLAGAHLLGIDPPHPAGHGDTAARDCAARVLSAGCVRCNDEHHRGDGERETIDPHDDLTVGFCQPPGGATLESTSFGPQVPGSYSWTGVPAFSTGSTIRHASST